MLIKQDTCCYRCVTCRGRFGVEHGHPLLSRQGHGAVSPSLAVFVWWSWLEDKPATTTARELHLSENTVRELYDMAATVCADNAIRMQKDMVFGWRGDETTEIEADETCFAKWSVDGAPGEPQRHFFYVWVGICQRGDLTKLWLTPLVQSAELPVGVSCCEGERRIPPLREACWRAAATQAGLHKTGANTILMTDSAAAYGAVHLDGVVQHHKVNHSEHEYSRSVEVTANARTGTRRPGMAGTQVIDRTWRSLKETMPHRGVSCKTARRHMQHDTRYV